MNFCKTKQSRLAIADLSKKGSIDDEIMPLVEMINDTSSYFTTSSCSGRICIFQEANGVQKKGCEWLYVTHKHASKQQLEDSLSRVNGDAFFKFEPFVLHVQCSDIEKARMMHEAAVASGFRNSGISIGKKGKIITAVRSTHGLEVPLSKDGRILITTEYLHHITELANEKMEENIRRIGRFTSNVRIALEKIKADGATGKGNPTKEQGFREEGNDTKSAFANCIQFKSKKEGFKQDGKDTQPSSTDCIRLKSKNPPTDSTGSHCSLGVQQTNTDKDDCMDIEVSFLFDNV